MQKVYARIPGILRTGALPGIGEEKIEIITDCWGPGPPSPITTLAMLQLSRYLLRRRYAIIVVQRYHSRRPYRATHHHTVSGTRLLQAAALAPGSAEESARSAQSAVVQAMRQDPVRAKVGNHAHDNTAARIKHRVFSSASLGLGGGRHPRHAGAYHDVFIAPR